VWNDHDKAHLEKEVQRVMADLRQRSPRWWSLMLWVCPPLGALAGLWSWYRMRRVQREWDAMKKTEKAKL
jgi:dephospho-CoA kinase